MKRILSILLLISSVAGAQNTFDLSNPRLWMRDACEAKPQVSWGINPTQGYTFITGGNQNWDNPSVLNYIQVNSTYKRTGNSSYKVYVEKPSEYNNANKDVRMEVMWLDPGRQNASWEWRWAGISILIPQETKFETRRAMIGFDHKEVPDDLRTPFGLCIQAGRYHISGRIVGPDGYVEDMGPVIRGQWEDWLLERNWSTGSDGYMRFYKNGKLMWEKYGPNISAHTQLITRIQHGWYKWVWETSTGQGEGTGAPMPGEPANAPSAPLVLYMDEIRFGKTTATINDMLVGGTTSNVPPTITMGTNKSITLTTNSSSVSVTATDSDGTIASYAWVKSSGPAGGVVVSPTSATTNITGMNTAGTYVFQVTVTDNGGATSVGYQTITVNSAAQPNAPPNVYAGSNKTITLPLDSVFMDGGQGGVNASDPEGGPLTFKWRRESGTGTIQSQNSLNTWITDLEEGDNKFWLTVTDNKGDTATDYVHVYVNPQPAPPNPPVAIAGPATQTVTLPLDSAFISGAESYVLGDSIQTYAWTKLAGPSGGSIRASSTPSTVVYGLTEGTYVYRLIVTAYNTKKDTADVTVIVAPEPVDDPPTITISGDSVRYIRNPITQLTFNGVSSGDVTAVQWTKLSGPAGGNIVSATNDTTVIKDLVNAGKYIYQITVTDASNQTATDQIVIWVEGLYIQRFLIKKGNNPARE